MRIGTSQTSPFFFGRQVHLRMLSFVGLIAFIIITLGVMNTRNPNHGSGEQSGLTAPQTFEVRREPRLLDSNEFVVTTGFEDGSPRASSSEDNRDLFQARGQKQTDDEMFKQDFRRRRDRNDDPWADDPTLQDNSQSNLAAPRTRPDDFRVRNSRTGNFQPVTQQPAGRWSGSTEFTRNENIERKRDSLSPRSLSSIDEGEENQDGWDSSLGSYIDDAPNSDPLKQPIEKDPWITDSTEPESFREDRASVRIDKQYLYDVKDNGVGIRRDESPAYYWLLDHVRRVAPSELDRAGLRDVQYVNLMTEPETFRGEPIAIEGDLWRLDEFEAGRNERDLNRIYVGWIFTSDSGNHPYRVVCTSLGRGIVPGENLRTPVRVTGYFFKREGYQSNGGVHFAPTLLARRMAINPMPNGFPLMSGILPYMVGTLVAIGLALLVTVVAFANGDERSMYAGLRRLNRYPQLAIASSTVATPISVEESLRNFAERERQTAISGAYGPLVSRQTAREHAVHDYATSQQAFVNERQYRHQRQTDVLQDWASRQKQSQAEIDVLRSGQLQGSYDFNADGDELNSDRLAPATNILVKQRTYIPPTPVPNQTTPMPLISKPSSVSPYIQSNYTTVTHSPSIITGQPLHSQISYGASKLSEYEDEIARMTNRSSLQSISHPIGTNSLALSAAEQIERDRIVREQQIRDQIHRQQAETERQRLLHANQERLEHERSERERHQHELHERNRIAQERSTYDRSHHATNVHHESSSHVSRSSMTVAEQLEYERMERERLQREHQERERLAREHSSFHRDHSTSHSHSSLATFDSERLERERYEREREERERIERERHERDGTSTHHEYVRHGHSVGEHEYHESETDSIGDLGSSESERRKSGKRRGGWGWPQRRRHSKTGDVSASDITESGELGAQPPEQSEEETRTKSGKRRGGWGWPKRRKHSGDSETTSEPEAQ